MSTYLKYVVRDLQQDIKKGKPRAVIKKTEGIIQQDQKIFNNQSSPHLLIKFMYIESYACWKIFIKELVKLSSNQNFKSEQQHHRTTKKTSFTKNIKTKKSITAPQQPQNNILEQLVSIIFRNFKYLYNLIDSIFNFKLMMMKLIPKDLQKCGLGHKSGSECLPQDGKITKIDLNRLFQIAIWVVKSLILYLEYSVQAPDICLSDTQKQFFPNAHTVLQCKIKILSTCESFLSRISEYGYDAQTKNRQLQEIQVSELYMANLIRNNQYSLSKQYAVLNICRACTFSKGPQKSPGKQTEEEMCILLFLAHIGDGQINSSKQLYNCIQMLIDLSGVKRFHDRFQIFPNILRDCQRISVQCQDFDEILATKIFSEAEISSYVENSKIAKFTFTPVHSALTSALSTPKTSKQVNNTKTQVEFLQLTSKLINSHHPHNGIKEEKMTEKITHNRAFNNLVRNSKNKQNTWCNLRESPENVTRNGILKSSGPNRRTQRFNKQSINFYDTKTEQLIKLSSVNFQQFLPTVLLESQQSSEIIPHKKGVIQKNREKVSKRVLPSDNDIQKKKEQLKLKKELIFRNRKFKSMDDFVNLEPVKVQGYIDKFIEVKKKKIKENFSNSDCQKSQEKDNSRNSPHSNNNKKKSLNLKNTKTAYNKLHEKITNCLQLFYRLILNNRHKLKISEYSCRIENYLDKIYLQRTELFESMNKSKNCEKPNYTRILKRPASRINLKTGSSNSHHRKSRIQSFSNKQKSQKILNQYNPSNPLGSNKTFKSFKSINEKGSSKALKKMNSLSTKNIQYGNELQSECTINSMKNTCTNINKQGPQHDNENRLNNCYRKSFQSIENIIKRMNDFSNEGKLTRKSNLHYKIPKLDLDDNRFSLF